MLSDNPFPGPRRQRETQQTGGESWGRVFKNQRNVPQTKIKEALLRLTDTTGAFRKKAEQERHESEVGIIPLKATVPSGGKKVWVVKLTSPPPPSLRARGEEEGSQIASLTRIALQSLRDKGSWGDPTLLRDRQNDVWPGRIRTEEAQGASSRIHLIQGRGRTNHSDLGHLAGRSQKTRSPMRGRDILRGRSTKKGDKLT